MLTTTTLLLWCYHQNIPPPRPHLNFQIYFFWKTFLRIPFFVFITSTMFSNRPFPSNYMLGLDPKAKRAWDDDEIIAHPEFAVRTDLIIEHCRDNGGFYFGEHFLTFGKYLSALYVTKKLSSGVIARLEAVDFPFSPDGEMISYS
jgi:hypothetical protein